MSRSAVVGCCLALAALALGGLPAVAQTAEEIVASGAVEIRTRIDPEGPILVGQKVSLWVEILTNTWFPQPPQFPDSLEATDAVVVASTSGTSFVDRRGRETFAGIGRRYDIYPLRPGQIPTPTATVAAVVALESGGRSPEIALTTEPRTIEATLPEEAAGLGLVVASPNVSVEDGVDGDPAAMRVGESMKRTVAIRIEDSVSMLLPAPDLGAPEGVATYSESPEFTDRTDRGVVSGERIDRATYVFEEEGEFVLPRQEIRWWNTAADRLETETLDEIEIFVGPNPDLAEEHFGIAEEETEPAPAEAPAAEQGPDWRRLALVLLVAAGLAWLLLRRLRRWSAGRERRQREKEESEEAAFAQLRQSLGNGSANEIYDSALRWITRLEAGGLVSWRDLLELGGGTALESEMEGLEHELFGDPSSSASSWSRDVLGRELEGVRKTLLRHGESMPPTGSLPRSLNPTL